MPYITSESRNRIDTLIDALLIKLNQPGELNYALTRLVDGYVHTVSGMNYASIAEVTGVLENVKQEYYRRVAVPYENLKMSENGDVYGGPK